MPAFCYSIFIVWNFVAIFLYSTQIKKSYLAIATTPPISTGETSTPGETGRCPPLSVSRYVTRYSPTLRWAKVPGGKENRSTGDGFTGVHWFTWKLACCNWINGDFSPENSLGSPGCIYIYTCIYVYIYIYWIQPKIHGFFQVEVFPKKLNI